MRLLFNPLKKAMWVIGATFYRVLLGRPLFQSCSLVKLKSEGVASYVGGLDESLFELNGSELNIDLGQKVKRAH
jgi:hypothetical protein